MWRETAVLSEMCTHCCLGVFLSVNKLLLTKCRSCFLLFISFYCSSWMYILPIGSVQLRDLRVHYTLRRTVHAFVLGHHLWSKGCRSVTCGFFWPVRAFLHWILYLFYCSSSFKSNVMRKSAALPVDSSRQIRRLCSGAAVCWIHSDSCEQALCSLSGAPTAAYTVRSQELFPSLLKFCIVQFYKLNGFHPCRWELTMMVIWWSTKINDTFGIGMSYKVT